mmetsp:Transcript_29822/g.59997  ORF Transcript_29822/g.59997 Transcript_29822/m.59997 type:complete len:457 (+) Transcript_29822:91-1461(+)
MAANPTAAPPTTAATTTSSTNNPTPSISPIKKTTSSSNKSPTSSKSKHSSSDHVKFTSTTSKKSPTKKSSTTSSTAATEKQLKLQKAEIAKRELKELESMERAFRQDVEVWAGPSNVVFPRRYHSLMQLKQTNSSNNSSSGGGGGGNTKKKENRNGKGNEVYYGSQSQGWMYGDGFARMGGLSWMDVTTPPSSASTSSNKRKKSDAAEWQSSTSTSSSSGFLMDDVSIIDKSLHSAGLTRSHLTPRAYACLLEQARRYTLELLADAQDYALHAQRGSGGSGDNPSMITALQPSDLLLAVEMREDTNGVSSTLPRVEDVQYVAEEVNRVPLPSIPRECYGGVVLPPVEEQLTARTFDVVNGARVVQRMMRGGDYPMGLSEVGNLGKKGGGSGGRKTGSYGAATGRQISVNLKSGKVVDEKSKSGGSSVVGGGSAASAPAASKASSDSKGQKRRLTEL